MIAHVSPPNVAEILASHPHGQTASVFQRSKTTPVVMAASCLEKLGGFGFACLEAELEQHADSLADVAGSGRAASLAGKHLHGVLVVRQP